MLMSEHIKFWNYTEMVGSVHPAINCTMLFVLISCNTHHCEAKLGQVQEVALTLMVAKQPGLCGAILYDFIFVGGSCVRVRQLKIEENNNNNKKIFPLPRSHVITEDWKFLGFEKSSQNLMLGIVFNFSREVGNGARSTPVTGDGYYDLLR